MTINNVSDLLRHNLDTLEQLERREIEPSEASARQKLLENAVSILKTELAYNHQCGNEVEIPFLQGSETKVLRNIPLEERLPSLLGRLITTYSKPDRPALTGEATRLEHKEDRQQETKRSLF